MTNRTANANLAPRCQHTKMNGQPCAAPARRGRRHCVFHEAAHAKRPDYTLRLVEDAMSLQLALFQVMRSLDDHAIDTKRAALKLYALQIAASNLKRLHEEINYVPSEDPARQQSLVELLLDQFGIPKDQREPKPEQIGENMDENIEENIDPPPAFDIQAVAEELPRRSFLAQSSSTTKNRKPTTDDRKPKTANRKPTSANPHKHFYSTDKNYRFPLDGPALYPRCLAPMYTTITTQHQLHPERSRAGGEEQS